jgi:hypothetical protein
MNSRRFNAWCLRASNRKDNTRRRRGTRCAAGFQSGLRRLRVKGGCGRQADGAAGLPSAPEMPCAPRQLRLVPIPDLMLEGSVRRQRDGNSVRAPRLALSEIKDPATGSRVRRDRGSQSCSTASRIITEIDRLVLGAHVRRRPARSGGSGQRPLREALRRARLF